MDPNNQSYDYNQMFPNGTSPWTSSNFGSNSNTNQIGNNANNGMNWNEMAGGAGGLISGLMSLFSGNNTNPANAAMPFYNQINGTNQSILGPYSNMGQGIGNPLMQQLQALMSNPGATLNSIGSNYHQSPGFQFQLHQALMGANSAAAAGGMAGSPMNTQQNMSLANSLANQDYYNYTNQASNLYGEGLQGAGNMFGTGAEAATNMAGNISQGMSMQALAAYLGQQNQNQNSNSMFGNIGGGIGDILGGIASHFGL